MVGVLGTDGEGQSDSKGMHSLDNRSIDQARPWNGIAKTNARSTKSF